MSSIPRVAPAGRTPIRLPQQTIPLFTPPAASSFTESDRRLNSSNTQAENINSQNTNTKSGTDIGAGTAASSWVAQLHSFAQQQAGGDAGAHLRGSNLHHKSDFTFRSSIAETQSEGKAMAADTPLFAHLEATRAASGEVAGSTAPPPGLGQRVLTCTEELSALEARLRADEGYFADVAEVEMCVMRHLHQWQQYAEAEGSGSGSGSRPQGLLPQLPQNGSPSGSNRSSAFNSPRESGLYGGRFSESGVRLSGPLAQNNNNSNSNNNSAALTGDAAIQRNEHNNTSTHNNSMRNSTGSVGSTAAGGGGVGSQRVQRDLEAVRQATEVMSDLHEALAALEDEHRGLQRHYIVEKTPFAELEALRGRLTELEKAAQDTFEISKGTTAAAAATTTSVQTRAGASKRSSRKPHRDVGRGKAPLGSIDAKGFSAEENAAITASLAACHTLIDGLRSRMAAVAERLTDELLWMRAEVRRHDWTVVRSATALTRMEAVSVALTGSRDTTKTNNNIIGRERKNGGVDVGPGRWKKEEGEVDPGASSRSSSSSSRSDASSASTSSSTSANFSHGVGRQSGSGSGGRRSSSHRDSFLLRVQVPVFVSAVAPPLPVACEDAVRGSDTNNNNNTVGSTAAATAFPAFDPANPRRLSGTAAPTNISSYSNYGSDSSLGPLPSTTLSISAPTATVSVVATPARYALTQLFEGCRDFLAQMLTRLTHVRRRRSAEAEQLAAAQQSLDMYDPAADEVTQKLIAVRRYVSQLDADVQGVQRTYQALHERVKLPMDAALQTYERFRTQLLEVLKQRLEQAEAEAEAAQQQQQRTTLQNAREGGRVGDSTEAEDEDGRVVMSVDEEMTTMESQQACQQRNVSLEQDEERAADPRHSQQQSDGEYADEERTNASRQASVASLSQERARRSTQSPQQQQQQKQQEEEEASSSSSPLPALPGHDQLPRASAEFLGMLDTLLKNQQTTAAAAASAAAAAAAAAATSVETAKPATENEEKEVHIVVSAPAVAVDVNKKDASVNAVSNSLDGAARTAFTAPTEDTAHGAQQKISPPLPADAQGTSAHLAGRRRPREEGAGEEEDSEQPLQKHDAIPIQPTVTADGNTSTNATAAPPTANTAHTAVVVVSSTTSDSADDVSTATSSSASSHSSDASEDEEEEYQSDPRRRKAAQQQPQRQRYGLGSENGLVGGLRAFFSAVGRRMVDFGDSDDDAVVEDAGKSTRSAPKRKRARHE